MTLPLLKTLQTYPRSHLSGDISAGLIVAVMLIPQGMAYALLAGLPPVVGLYASTIPVLVYALIGSSKQLAVGPVAIVALMTLSGVSTLAEPGTANFIALATLLALMIGVLQLSMGLLRFGFLVNFMSHAVISGFTSAAAIIIGLSQLKHLLGVNLPRTHNVFELLWEAGQTLGEVNLIMLAIGGSSILILLLAKQVSKRFPTPLLVVILATLSVNLFRLDARGVAIVGNVPAGVAGFHLPRLDIASLQGLLPAAITIAFVSFMESIAVAKSIASKAKDNVDANQELIGLGLANIAGSLFQAYPVTGGFSRSAVNYQAGAKSPLASVITALLIVLTLLFFTNLFTYLPSAVLAAIVMVAVVGLIDVHEPVHLFQVKPTDGWSLVLTFVATLSLGIEVGILIGVSFSLLVFIWRSARPHTAELGYLPDVRAFRNINRYPDAQHYAHTLIVRPDAALYFANMGFLDNWLDSKLHENDDLRYLILDFSGVNDVDAVALNTLEALMLAYDQVGIATHLAAVKGPVRDLLTKAGWYTQFPDRLTHLSVQHAVDALELVLEHSQLSQARTPDNEISSQHVHLACHLQQ
ncbi:MAG: solute carrier family 26 protein [Deinococcota bacterium]